MTLTEKNQRLQDLRRELATLRRSMNHIEDMLQQLTKVRPDSEMLVDCYFGSEYESGICYD